VVVQRSALYADSWQEVCTQKRARFPTARWRSGFRGVRRRGRGVGRCDGQPKHGGLSQSAGHALTRATGGGVQNLIFRFLQSKARIQIWLFEQNDLRVEGRIIVRAQSQPSLSLLLRPLTKPRVLIHPTLDLLSAAKSAAVLREGRVYVGWVHSLFRYFHTSVLRALRPSVAGAKTISHRRSALGPNRGSHAYSAAWSPGCKCH